MTTSDLSMALLRPSGNKSGLLPGICGASWSRTSHLSIISANVPLKRKAAWQGVRVAGSFRIPLRDPCVTQIPSDDGVGEIGAARRGLDRESCLATSRVAQHVKVELDAGAVPQPPGPT